MTQQRRSDFRRGRPGDPVPAPRQRDSTPRDPGAYIGRMPERAVEPIPAANPQPAPARGTEPVSEAGGSPVADRKPEQATDRPTAETGQNR